MGGSGEWDTKRTHSLLIDDTKTFKESQKKKLEIANDIIVKASQDTGGSFHIYKCDKKGISTTTLSDLLEICTIDTYQ